LQTKPQKNAERTPTTPLPIERPAISGGAYLASFFAKEQRYPCPDTVSLG
jgi:hypothetical protein